MPDLRDQALFLVRDVALAVVADLVAVIPVNSTEQDTSESLR
jgi:hypothetical protein